MARRDDIIDFADELLDSRSVDDHCPNGLQVEGADEVTLVVSGVSASAALFERAVEVGAELVICHHGLFWKATPQVVDGPMRRRLRLLLAHDVSLAAWHLPLDAHAEIGNNALIADALELRRGTPFGRYAGMLIGATGTYDEPIPFATLVERVRSLTDRDPLHLGPAPDPVTTVAVCSGGAGSLLDQAAVAGAQVLITGEAEEPTMALAHELGIACIAGGHWATETFGIRALGERLAERFDVRHTFVSLANPV